MSKDSNIAVQIAVGKLGPVKAGDFSANVKTVTRDLLGVLPKGDRVYIEQMMFAAFCSSLQVDTSLTASEKTNSLRDYTRELRKSLSVERNRERGAQISGERPTEKPKTDSSSTLKESIIPRLDGVAYVSYGSADEPGIGASVYILVIAANPSEVPVVPIDFGAVVQIGKYRVDLVPIRPTEISQGFRVRSGERLGEPLMSGDWTGCFSGESYLVGPGKLNIPVSRDRPLVGVMLAYSLDIPLVAFRAANRLVVTVHTVDGRSYEIFDQPNASRDSMRQQLVMAGTWNRGFKKCSP